MTPEMLQSSKSKSKHPDVLQSSKSKSKLPAVLQLSKSKMKINPDNSHEIYEEDEYK